MKKQIPWNLIIAKLEHTISSDDDQLLTEWLSDSKHLQVYEEISALWKKVQERANGYAPQPALYWNQVAKQLNLPSVQKERKRSYSIKTYYKVAVCAALLLASSLSFYFGLEWNAGNDILEQCYTNVNGKSQVTLPDGTIVWLHSNTTLAYKNDFKKNNRTVNLQGEAYFEVTKDKHNRFIVHTEGVDVAVYGTKFNVFSRPDKEGVNVSLLEGSVAFTTASNPQERFLSPGEMVTYNKKSHETSITDVAVDMNAAWATPTVKFSNHSLEQICEVLSKRFDVNIQVDPELGKKYVYTFTLHDENVYEILELIASIHPINYSFKNDGSISITK